MSYRVVDRPKRRACLFLISLLIRTFGMALTIRAGLGASPSSCVPYAASLVYPAISLTVYGVIVSLVEVMIQKIFYRKYMSKLQMFVQVVVSFLFGIALGSFTGMLGILNPTDYVLQIFCAVLGCAVMAFGVYVELVANFTMLTGDGMNRAISYVTKIKYGYVKMATDIGLVLIAVVIGFIGTGELIGVGVGTIIAAILVGPIVNVYNKYLVGLSEKLMPKQQDSDDSDNIALSF